MKAKVTVMDDTPMIVELNKCMEIHLAIGDVNASGITFGQDYNPTVYRDLITTTVNALRESLTIAIDHGYTFPTDQNEDDDDDDAEDGN